MKTKFRVAALLLAASATALAACGDDSSSSSGGTAGGKVGVTLIVKNTSNPFFVAMQKEAQASADSMGVGLTFAGVPNGAGAGAPRK